MLWYTPWISVFTLAVFPATVAVAPAAEFAIDSPAPLAVSYGGQPLIVAESAVPEFDARPVARRAEVEGWETVFQIERSDSNSTTRAEVGTSAGSVEFTFERLVEADVAGFVRYGFVVPHRFLDGHRGEVIGTGVRVRAEHVRRRKLDGPLGGGGIADVRPVKYLRVHHPAGPIDFDFNPRGSWTGQKTVTPRAAEWSMRRTREGYVFWTAFSRTKYGTLQEFKFVIGRADERPVEEVHPQVATRWTNPYRNTLKLSVGSTRVKGYDTLPLEGGRSARWLDPERVRIQHDERFEDASQTRYEGACPARGADRLALEIDVGRDGFYLLNLLVGAPDRPIGPCRTSTAGKPDATLPAVEAGQYDSWAAVVEAEEGRIALRLDGDVRLAAVGVAPMLYENEDFLFRRGWWLAPKPDEWRILDRLAQ